MWCVPSLTHSSSHSQTFSIRAHSSLPGFFKRLEISSGGLRCHPNGNRSASRKGWSKKPHAQSHGQAIRDTSSEQKKLTPQKEKRSNGDIIKSQGEEAVRGLFSQRQTLSCPSTICSFHKELQEDCGMSRLQLRCTQRSSGLSQHSKDRALPMQEPSSLHLVLSKPSSSLCFPVCICSDTQDHRWGLFTEQ